MKHPIKHWLWIVSIFFLTSCGPYFPALAERPVVKVSQQDVLALSGDPARGQALFMGNTTFAHEGPQCMGCHSVGENGILGGGVMGPNLTNVTGDLSKDQILDVLSSSPDSKSPVMRPIYTDAPLTAQEQADLLAFLQASKGQPEADREIPIFGISLTGTLFAIAAIGFIYRGRLRGVRRALVEKAQAENKNMNNG